MNPKNKILIYHLGQLGDTLIAVPALWTIRKNFPDAKITLLSDRHIGKSYVFPAEILTGSALVDDFLYYPVSKSAILKPIVILALTALLLRLMLSRYDTLVYLVPSRRSRRQINRDIRFFKAAGVKTIIGDQGFPVFPPKVPGQPLQQMPRETDLLMFRLVKSNIPCPPFQNLLHPLKIGENELLSAQSSLPNFVTDQDHQYIGLGIGAKRPVCIWPLERYVELATRLIEEFDIWPIIFGGPQDKASADILAAKLPRACIAAGRLTVRQTMALMARACRIFVGNDTGTIHIAAMADVPCVGIYSARNPPGLWEPYGTRHTVLRKHLPCDGCMLDICSDRNNECLTSITVDQVFEACTGLLDKST